MPWKDMSIMDAKIEFINEFRSGAWSMTELCRQFGISRTLGYKYLRRYQLQGLDGLAEVSRAPAAHPNQTAAFQESTIVALRKVHPKWGAETIITVLKDLHPDLPWPSISTGNEVLKRNGLVLPRRRIRRITPTFPIFDPKAPNETWSADFKGKFRMGNGVYCHPLTIADSFSRYVFAVKGLLSPCYVDTRKVFESVFKNFGMPQQIHTDNGIPFAVAWALARLSPLSVWFIELGIEPVYSDPGHPEQNGRHERMHRDLKAEVTKPPAKSLVAQQRKLTDFMIEYNHVRPHKALDNITPAKVHVPSQRQFPNKIQDWDYPSNFQVRRVYHNGAIRWTSHAWVTLTNSLIDRYIGLGELDNDIWRVYFRQHFLGYLDGRTRQIDDGIPWKSDGKV